MRSAFLIIIILTFFHGKTSSQQPAKFHVTYYTTENGLPSNGIKGLQWDEQTGFLWIATEAGISRFNGLDFENFTITNTPFITSERMLFLIRNNKGKIYASDQYGNLCYVKNNNLAFYKRSKDNNRFTISVSDVLFNDKIEYTGKKTVAINFDQIVPTSDTSCFIVISNKIYKYSAGLSDLIPYPDSLIKVRRAFELQKQCFIVNDQWQTYELNNDQLKNKLVPVLQQDGNKFDLADKNSLFFWSKGMENPIIINKNKAWILSLSQNNIIATQVCDEIPTDALIGHVQYIPQKKLLILGTISKGLIVLSQNRVTVMRNLATISNEPSAYYAQVELPGNEILTSEGHIIGSQISKASLPIHGKFSYLTTITKDSLLWYSQINPELSNLCLHNYDLKTGKTTIYKKVPGSGTFVYMMSDGQLLLATDSGLGFLEGDSIKYLYRHKDVTYNTPTYKIEEIEKGVVLLATCTGILRFNIKSKRIDTLLNTEGYCIRSTWRYKDYIFFGSYGKGFFVWKNGVLKSMPIDKKKYLLYTHCFMPDDESYCWISTNRGLFKAKIDELINAYERNLPAVYYHYFGKNDGMNIMEMNGGCTPCALQLKNKTLSFPTMDGLLWVDPVKAKPILPDGEIYIDEIIADSVRIDADQTGEITLSSNTNDVTIRLGFSAWCNKENIYIDYQLNDTINWRPVNTDADALIHLSSLSPGDYVLRFRKMNGFGINNYSYKTIRFSITTPWYKSWWFNVLIVFGIAGLVLLYVNLRTRQLKINQQKLERQVAEKTKELQEKNEVLEKNNSIKTRLISIISHDIVTPLKFLTAAGKNLIDKRKAMSEELQNETLGEMANTSQELQMLSTNILNWIKYQNENRRLAREKFNVHELVEQVTGILKSLAKQKQLLITNKVDPGISIYQYYEPLKILIYNLLTNAINFSEHGEIIIDAEKENEILKIWVKDNGLGMTQDQIQHLIADEIVITAANADKRKGHGLGYLIIKDLLKMTGGSLHIESEKGKGSKISIILPMNHKNNL